MSFFKLFAKLFSPESIDSEDAARDWLIAQRNGAPMVLSQFQYWPRERRPAARVDGARPLSCTGTGSPLRRWP